MAAAVAFIDAYKVALSPFFAGACRFEPSCSAFAREALTRHGFAGFPLAAGRILRCRPFGGAGFDPVPEISSHDRETPQVHPHP